MTQLYSFPESKHPLLSTLFYDNLISFVIYMYSNPLHLAYLLYFSPYLLQLLCFLFPLLLSTSILVLLLSLHFTLEPDIPLPSVCLLDQLTSLVVASIGNVFEWEFEAMLELYNNLGHSNFGVEVYVESSEQSELLLESDVVGRERKVNFGAINVEPKDPNISVYESLHNGRDMEEVEFVDDEKSVLVESDFGIGYRVSLKGSSFEPENPIVMTGNSIELGRSMGDLYEILTPNCDMREDPTDFRSKNLKRIEVMESQTRKGDQVSSKGDSFVPQTPDRIYEILISSPLNRKAGHGDGQCLPRSRSMKTTSELDKHSTLNCEVLQDPNLEFLNKLLKSHSTEGRFKSFSIRKEEQECRAVGGLQRDGSSTRKEKEWKRTLACKLYEERMASKLREGKSVDEGAEEMDLLWEAYEVDADKANKFKSKGKNGKRQVHIKEEDEVDEKEEGDETVGKFCCLQALRMSTGKMNLGVGRPNLMKISKAIKGIGFFHRSGSSQRRNG